MTTAPVPVLLSGNAIANELWRLANQFEHVGVLGIGLEVGLELDLVIKTSDAEVGVAISDRIDAVAALAAAVGLDPPKLHVHVQIYGAQGVAGTRTTVRVSTRGELGPVDVAAVTRSARCADPACLGTAGAPCERSDQALRALAARRCADRQCPGVLDRPCLESRAALDWPGPTVAHGDLLVALATAGHAAPVMVEQTDGCAAWLRLRNSAYRQCGMPASEVQGECVLGHRRRMLLCDEHVQRVDLQCRECASTIARLEWVS